MALESIHSHNIVHTDIKPDNIWISDDPARSIIFIDFGLADFSDRVRTMKTGKVTLTKHINKNAVNRIKGGRRRISKTYRFRNTKTTTRKKKHNRTRP